jgi:hypothetical protein
MKDEETRQWWTEKVENGYFNDFMFAFSRPDLINKFDLKGKKILEIGFGYGRELSQFCKLSDDVYGADIAPTTIDLTLSKLKEQGIDLKPKLKGFDGINLPFNEKFDFIYSCFVIQHMSKKNAAILIGNCIDKLNNKGYILFEFYGHPKYFKPEMLEDVYSGDPNNGGMYNNAYDITSINHLMLIVGKGRIEWIENWSVYSDGISFNNYWVCICKN